MAGVSKKVINVFGMVKLSGTNVLKVELASYNGNAGVDVRSWYTKDAEKVTEQDKASMDAKGYLPGKGVFLPLTHIEWLVKKLEGVLSNEDFKKLLVEVKTSKVDKAGDKAEDKVSKENELLKAKLAEMEALMKKLAAGSAKAEAATAKDTTADELEDIALPESSVTGGKGKGKGKK